MNLKIFTFKYPYYYFLVFILILTVAEAKKYRAEKERIVQKKQARNGFESYAYSLRNIIRVSFSDYWIIDY